jgi:hypothetical protein
MVLTSEQKELQKVESKKLQEQQKQAFLLLQQVKRGYTRTPLHRICTVEFVFDRPLVTREYLQI